MIVHYCLGFLFTECYKSVILIEKKRPDWQAGLWNGIGGYVEEKEFALDAMRREFREETGVALKNWKISIIMDVYEKDKQVAKVHIFKAVNTHAVSMVETMTDELVNIRKVKELPDNIIPNLNWIIPMLTQPLDFPIEVKEYGKGGVKL